MSNIIYWIIVGGIAGVLAKALTPGTAKEPKGCLYTIGLGIVGSLIVGLFMEFVLGMKGQGGLIPTTIGATIGAVLLILVLRKFWK